MPAGWQVSLPVAVLLTTPNPGARDVLLLKFCLHF
jgi:hypothetical protein